MSNVKYMEIEDRVINFLRGKDGNIAKMREIKDVFLQDTINSLNDLTISPGSVVLDMIDRNKLYLDPDWNVGLVEN